MNFMKNVGIFELRRRYTIPREYTNSKLLTTCIGTQASDMPKLRRWARVRALLCKGEGLHFLQRRRRPGPEFVPILQLS